MESASNWILSQDDVRQFEGVLFDALASLMRATVDEVPANPDGYAFFESAGLRALLSTNPYARSFCSAIGVTRCTGSELTEAVRFFEAHGILPKLRVPPDEMTVERAQLLAEFGLMHTGFHTVLYAPISALPASPVRDESPIKIEEVRDDDRFEDFLKAQILGWGIPESALEQVKSIRRTWRTAPGHRSYLATVDGEPAAHAVMFEAGDIAYLSSASTLPAFRRRGLQSRLIQRRINDPGCRKSERSSAPPTSNPTAAPT